MQNVSKILNFVLKQTKSGGFKSSGFLTTSNEGQPMYGHGFGLLFLAQIYGTSSDPDINKAIKNAIRKCVSCTSRAQSKDGGWFGNGEPQC